MSITYEVTVNSNGRIEWRLNGKCHREDGPAVELADGSKSWYLNGQYHREDGPAIEHADGSKSWCLNGQYHREDGPAIEYVNGSKYWYLNNENVTQEEFNARMNPAKEMTLVEIEKLLGYPVKVVK